MKKLSFVLVLILVVFTVSLSFAVEPSYMTANEYYTESQDIATSDKVADLMAYEPPTMTVIKDGKEELGDESSKAVALETIYSKNLKTINIPLSYGMPINLLSAHKERLNLCLILPYTEREMGSEKDSGLGDISLSTDYLVRLPSLLLDSKLSVKFPTAEIKDADVALGTGSYDIGLLIKGTFYLEKLALKGGIGYTLTGDYEDGGMKLVYGDDIFLSAGAFYTISDTLSAGGELIYNSHAEDEIEFSGGGSYYAAGLATTDLVPSVTWLYTKYDLAFSAKMIIPVYDDWTNDKAVEPSDDPDREMKFKVNVSKPF